MAKQKKKSKAGLALTIIGGIFLAGAVVLLGFGINAFRLYQTDLFRISSMRKAVDQDTYYPGVRIDGVDVGGKTYAQVLEILDEKHQQEIKEMVLKIKCDDKNYSLQTNAFFNTEYVAQQAYLVGREGTLEERYEVVKGLKEQPRDFTIKHVISTPEMNLLLQKIEQENFTPGEDALVTGFDAQSRQFSFSKEKAGLKLDSDGLRKAMENAVEKESFGAELEAKLLPVEPEITVEKLSNSFRMLSSFSTKTTSDSARNTNIRLATEALNGKAVAPGETFSFNAATGERTKAKGYKDAGAIKGGKSVQEPGGGVCQVSTTLFNAVVRAGMEVVTRHSHSWPSSYIKTGFDAAVNWPSTDFVFRNTSEYPVYLIGYLTPDGSAFKITVEVYGKPVLEEGITVELRYAQTSRTKFTTEMVVDRSMKPGTKEKIRPGHDNIRGTTYIRYMRGEELVKEEVLFQNNYPMITELYHVGPEPKPTQEKPASTPSS